MVPVPATELGGRQPVLALAPGIGDVDIVLASELLEAGRCVASGFVTPDRTTMIASTGRSYLVTERIAMGDGRLDSVRLTKAIAEHAESHLLIDMEALARQSGAMVNAVMLGLLAGCGRLPLPAQALEDAIRADGKAVDSNLRGFRAGLAAARRRRRRLRHDRRNASRLAAPHPAGGCDRRHAVSGSGGRGRRLPPAGRLSGRWPTRGVISTGSATIHKADERAKADGRLLREVARHLALRMSYEDVIRVAEVEDRSGPPGADRRRDRRQAGTSRSR